MTTRLTDREHALRVKLATDFAGYSRACLKIRTKSGAINPLLLNGSQAALHRRLEEQKARTGRVRALVLKARQVGISTYVSGRFYWRVTHSRGFRAFILAHLDEASDNLFGMAKRYHEGVPDMVRPSTRASNAKELDFGKLDSGYRVATAGGKEVGRSQTVQLFHGSEVGFWPNADQHFAGVMQALADAPGTECILESTANSVGNTFHSLWKAAERGENCFEPIFLPWFLHEEYAKEPVGEWAPPAPWCEYEQLYKLDRAQTYWAWEKNRDLAVVAGGSSDEPCWQFRQEYPANADEAFQTSGTEAFIAPNAVLRARKNAVVGYGPIILGIDPARGGGDKTGIIDRQGRRLGGHVCKRIDHGDLMSVAGEVVTLVRQIKPRKVVIDTTGLGAGLYDRLRELLGDLVEGVNFGAKAYNATAFANRRAEMWDTLRKWFEDPVGVQVPDSDELQGDLCSITRGPRATRFTSSGQLLLEAKEHIKQRLSFSPDLGDAAALTHAVDMSLLMEPVPAEPELFRGDDAWMGM